MRYPSPVKSRTTLLPLQNLRTLAVMPESEQNEARMRAAIAAFINQALQINVKG